MVGLFLSAATRAGPASWWDDGRGGPKSTGSRRRIDDIDDGDGPLAVRRRAHTSRGRRRRRSASAASGPCPPSAWREVATVGEAPQALSGRAGTAPPPPWSATLFHELSGRLRAHRGRGSVGGTPRGEAGAERGAGPAGGPAGVPLQLLVDHLQRHELGESGTVDEAVHGDSS